MRRGPRSGAFNPGIARWNCYSSQLQQALSSEFIVMRNDSRRLRVLENSIRRSVLGATRHSYEKDLRLEGQFGEEQLRMLEVLCAKDSFSREDRMAFTRILTNCFDEELLVRFNILESCHLFMSLPDQSYKNFWEGAKLTVSESMRLLVGLVLRGRLEVVYADGRRYSYDKGASFGDAEFLSDKPMQAVHFTRDSALLLVDATDFETSILPHYRKLFTQLSKRVSLRPLEPLPEFERTRVQLGLRAKSLSVGELLFKEGEEIKFIFFIKRGIFLENDEEVVLQDRCLGVEEVLSGCRKRRSSLRALEEVVVLAIRRRHYFQMIKYERDRFASRRRIVTQITEQSQPSYSRSLHVNYREMRVEIHKQNKNLVSRFRFLRQSDQDRGKPERTRLETTPSGGETEALVDSIRHLVEKGRQLSEMSSEDIRL